MTKELPSFLKRSADRILSYAEKSPEGMERLTPFDAIRILRRKLDMTQAQLAKRAGIPQSHVAQIERGRVDPQWSTLTKIFIALLCDLVVVPKPRQDLDKYKAELIQKAAEKRMRQLHGTMSLEQQNIDKQFREDLLKEAVQRHLKKHSKRIWDD